MRTAKEIETNLLFDLDHLDRASKKQIVEDDAEEIAKDFDRTNAYGCPEEHDRVVRVLRFWQNIQSERS